MSEQDSEQDIEAGESIEVTELVDDDGEVVGAVVDDLVVVTDGDTTVVDETVELVDSEGALVAEEEIVTVYDADGNVLAEEGVAVLVDEDEDDEGEDDEDVDEE